jgi:hypothetical protein
MNGIRITVAWSGVVLAAMLALCTFAPVAHAQSGNTTAGQAIYTNNCFACHGSGNAALGATSVAALNSALDRINTMQFMRGSFTGQEACDLVTHIARLAGAAAPTCGCNSPATVTRNDILLRRSGMSPETNVGKWTNDQLRFTCTADPGAWNSVLATADFDNKGAPSLAFLNTSAPGEFGDVISWPSFNSAQRVFWRLVKLVWEVQAVADMDGDGFQDIVWRYVVTESPDTGVSYIWFSSGTSASTVPFVSQVRKRGGAPLTWQLLGAVDINNDGAADMIYLSPAGQLRVLMATPTRTCANLVSGSMPTGFVPQKFARFRGGTTGEVLVRNATTGANQLLSLNAVGLTLPPYTGAPDDPNASCTSSSLSVPMTTINLPNADPTWTFYAAADLNNDGITDIVWRRANGQLTAWLLNAAGTVQTTVANAGTAPTGYTVFQNGGPKLN